MQPVVLTNFIDRYALYRANSVITCSPGLFQAKYLDIEQSGSKVSETQIRLGV
jgi:hypothetical protein